MNCTACGSRESCVLKSAAIKAGIARVRRCKACHHRWTTHEIDASELGLLRRASEIIRRIAPVLKEVCHG